MKLGSLYSGGKDSTFSIFKASQLGHNITCLITMHPVADDSLLFHYPNSWVTEYIADAMEIPLQEFKVEGRSKEAELKALAEAVEQARSMYGIEGIVHGGLSSVFQQQAFEEICKKHRLQVIAPLWNVNPLSYLKGLVDNKFDVIIVGVSAMGLGIDWLGRSLDMDSISELQLLSTKYGFNLAFEGGEAETLVVDCPLFINKRLDINKATIEWDGQRGIFEILEASLIPK